jgi:hypothetical protein
MPRIPVIALILSLLCCLCTISCSREEVRAGLAGFERGATAPRTVCTTTYSAYKRAGYSTLCNTY